MAGINWRPDPARPVTDYHTFLDDQELYLATNYVITETGSGTRAIAQADGGVLVVTNGGTDDDVNSLQWRDVASGQVAEHWKFVAGKELYFGCRLKVSDATQSDLVIGLHITATAPVATPPTDGIYFRKDDGDRLIDLVGIKNSTSSVSSGVLGVSGYLTDDTYTVLEFLYNGSTALITAYQDGIAFASIPLTNVVDDEELAISFAHQNGSTGAKVLSLDWIRVGKER
jgi:hypothetical protein